MSSSTSLSVTGVPHKYYATSDNEPLSHPLLKDARVCQSDYPWVRNLITAYAAVINAQVGSYRPVLWGLSLVSGSHSAYKQELEAIDLLTLPEREEIESKTSIYGGETEEAYAEVAANFDNWRNRNSKNFDLERTNKVFYFSKSDSLEAAVFIEKRDYRVAHVAITNFANSVRVGGADSTGGKGSQEEHLIRKSPNLRVSLEHAAKKADQTIRAETGRYLNFYSVIVSEDIPPRNNSEKKFTYISAAAPDLRTGIRSEGNYFKAQNRPDLIKEVLYRKLSMTMMAAAMKGVDALVLGAFGCGAFGNDPRMVAEVIKDLLNEDRFKNVFVSIILPIGDNDRNKAPFEEILKGKTVSD